MAKYNSKESHQPKRKKRGIHSISGTSSLKTSKNYKKKYKGQGKGR